MYILHWKKKQTKNENQDFTSALINLLKILQIYRHPNFFYKVLLVICKQYNNLNELCSVESK